MENKIKKRTIKKVSDQLKRIFYQSIISVSKKTNTNYNSTKKIIDDLEVKGLIEKIESNQGDKYRWKIKK